MQTLISIGKEYLEKGGVTQNVLSENREANDLLCNLEKFPHAFVLGCLMDFQIPAQRAWIIPYKVFTELNAFSMNELLKIEKADFIRVFENNSLHRFNTIVGGRFYDAIQKIHVEYNDNAAAIWAGNPSSSDVVARFRSFDGAGEKISSMAVNILYRFFKIPFADLSGIDVSPDVHVRKIFCRIGLVEGGKSKQKTNKLVIRKARSLYPDYPGVFDIGCWVIGQKYCYKINPACEKCPLSTECRKLIQYE